ncbi:MAG: DNA polymerase III subunit delta', partial [Actinomycetes bacterium]
DAVAQYLSDSEGVDPATALFAAKAAQGHIGRARALACDGQARERRQQILSVPARLADLASCLRAAREIVEVAERDAQEAVATLDKEEIADLERAWGVGSEGKGVKGGARGYKGVLKELETRQSSRHTRTVRDQLDRALVDLLAYYRDVMAVQFAESAGEPDVDLVNEEARASIERIARSTDSDSCMQRIEAIERARRALGANVAPVMAMEALTVDLRNPDLRASL